METFEIRKMRKHQFVLFNCLLVVVLSLYLGFAINFSITMAQSNLIIAIITLSTAIFTFITRNHPTSIFPILKQVQAYEKRKLGDEWKKQRKTTYISQFILSGLLFMQYFITRTINEPLYERAVLVPIIVIFIVIIAAINIALLLHNRKVDRSISPAEMRGYTKNANIIGGAIGIILGISLFVFIITYVMLTG